ncbi:hypothetical protein LINPERPRIM_LOCUS16491 [Linum perenne]
MEEYNASFERLMVTFERFCEMKELKLPASISGENIAPGSVLNNAPQVFDESPLTNSTSQLDNPLQAFEPPMFAGDSHPSSWLEACIRYFSDAKVPANEMVDEAGWFLENAAYFWFLDWENGRSAIEWDEFSHAILSRFGSSTPNTIAASSPPKSACPSSSTFPVTSENEPLQVLSSFPTPITLNFPNTASMAGVCVIDFYGRDVKKWELNVDYRLGYCLEGCCRAIHFQGREKYLNFKAPHIVVDQFVIGSSLVYMLLPPNFGFAFGFKGGGHLVLGVQNYDSRLWKCLAELGGRDVKKWECNNDSGLEACLSSFCTAVASQENGSSLNFEEPYKDADEINSWALKIKEVATMFMGLHMNASSKGFNESLEGSIASRTPILQCLIESGGTLVWSTRNCELLYPSYYGSTVHLHGLSNHCGFKEPYKDIQLAYQILDKNFGSCYTAGLRRDIATDANFATTIDKASINLVHGAGNSARATLIEEIFLGSHMGNNKCQNQVHWTRKKIHFPHYKGLLQPSSITELKAYTSFHLSHCTLLVSEWVIEAGGKIVLTFRMGCDLLYIRCSMKVCFSCSVNSFGRGNYFDFKEPYKDSQELLNASLSKKEFALSYLSDLQSRLLEGCNVMVIIEFVFKVPCHGPISFSHIQH